MANYFTADNTEGYSDADLAELNRRLDAALAAVEPVPDDIRSSHEKNLAAQVQAAFDAEG
jgi:hypothetical protein